MASPSQDLGGVVNQGHAQGPSDGVGQGIYDVSTIQKGRVGARRVMSDGRVFRYCYFGEACAAGKLAALDITSQRVATTAATAVSASDGTAADYAAGALGPLYLQDTDKFTGAHSDGVFDGGFVIHVDLGAMVKIRRSDYTGSNSVMSLDLYDPLPVAFDSEDTVQVVSSDFYGLTIAKASSDNYVVGVPLVTVAAGEYAWVQRTGTAPGYADGTIAAGMLLTLSDGVNGAVQEIGGDQLYASEVLIVTDFDFQELTTEPIIGNAITAGANTKFFFMTINFE